MRLTRGINDNDCVGNRLKYPHRTYLPNAIASYLCVHFRVMPGSLINEALRALATRVVISHHSPDGIKTYSVQESIDLIEQETK